MKVAVVGAGRVGIISGLVLYELGHQVTLFDVDSSRVAQLRAGEMPFYERDAAPLLAGAAESERWTATENADAIADGEAVLITVPTPAGREGMYQLRALQEVVSLLGRVRADTSDGPRWRGIFLRSTVLPGTTEGVLAAGLDGVGDGPTPCSVGYLPEFLREGTALADARRPDRVVVGAEDPDLHSLARELFDTGDTTFFETGIRTAELIKTSSNALLSICISFANEIARLAVATDGADAIEVFEGVLLDRRFRGEGKAGIADYFLPGPGFGGSCLGKDLGALAAFARARQQEPGLLEAALRTNTMQPSWFVERIEHALGGLQDRRVLVLGLAFKPETDDSRDSVAIPILRELAERGAEVRLHDPKATESIDPAKLASLGVEVIAEDALDAGLAAAEVVVLVTPWRFYLETLPEMLVTRATPLLFADARGNLRGVDRAACVTYLSVGASVAKDERGD